MTSADESKRLLAEALERHAARDTAGTIALARRAVELDPANVEALEHLGTVLVTRRRAYDEGLALLERAVSVRGDDPGLWYGLGWCYEFAAHEQRRRPTDANIDIRALYERAAAAFRRCLALEPEGKLQGDAEDLLDHVDNELASL